MSVDRPLIIDLDATLVASHSEKQQAAPTYKKSFGFHPLCAFTDHAHAGTGEPLVIQLRPGNAGSNTVTDHITVTRQALTQLPGRPRRPGRKVLVRADGGKAVLRDALARHVPRPLFEREKTGFSFPVGTWLRGPLRGWAEDLLASQRLRESGLVDRDRTSQLWTEHRAGRRDHASALWAVLMLAAWLEARA